MPTYEYPNCDCCGTGTGTGTGVGECDACPTRPFANMPTEIDLVLSGIPDVILCTDSAFPLSLYDELFLSSVNTTHTLFRVGTSGFFLPIDQSYNTYFLIPNGHHRWSAGSLPPDSYYDVYIRMSISCGDDIGGRGPGWQCRIEPWSTAMIPPSNPSVNFLTGTAYADEVITGTGTDSGVDPVECDPMVLRFQEWEGDFAFAFGCQESPYDFPDMIGVATE